MESGKYFQYHPDGVSLELKDFEMFFEQRRRLIKIELMRIFELPISNEVKEASQCKD